MPARAGPCCFPSSSRARAAGRIVVFALAAIQPARAVMFPDSADPAYNATSPGDNSGWQYSGHFQTFLGVPVGPRHFLTAKHIGGAVGMSFHLHGDPYVTVARHDHPTMDLTLWEVDAAKPFPAHAPLATGAADLGATATVFGRGTRRGDPVIIGDQLKGWKWGTSDQIKRWGRNLVAGTADDEKYGELLFCEFDIPGIPFECHLSTGDSGGGLFVLEDGLWRLAGIHLSVSGPFRIPPAGPSFNAALFDMGGLERKDDSDWSLVPDQPENQPSAFFSSRVAAALDWIHDLVPESAQLAGENYAAWRHWYFSPAQIADPLQSGPLADFDHDGIPNLLEFALNLDPVVAERTTMLPATGLRGLPVARLAEINGETRLTLEFVRRTAASGAALTYIAEFSDDLAAWHPAGSESATAINPRWQRVLAADPVPATNARARFARLRVVADPPET